MDVLTFTQWANAYAEGDKRLTDFYSQRFRDEFKPAVKAWVATAPLKNDDAPPTPFVLPEYELAKNAEADALVADAEASTADAREANQRSDNYVLAVVLFAAALFFAGISTKLSVPRNRTGVLALGYVLFLGTVAWLVTFPGLDLDLIQPGPATGAGVVSRPAPGRCTSTCRGVSGCQPRRNSCRWTSCATSAGCASCSEAAG